MKILESLTKKDKCVNCGHHQKKSKIEIFFSFFLLSMYCLGVYVLVMNIGIPVLTRVDFMKLSLSTKLGESYTNFAIEHDDELRELALNLTYPCDSEYPMCYTSKLFYKLNTLRYNPSSINRQETILYHPMYVYDNGGDCKNTAALFVSLMRSLGFESYVDCNIRVHHCVSVIPVKSTSERKYEDFYVVDLAYGSMTIYNSSQNFWDDYDE